MSICQIVNRYPILKIMQVSVFFLLFIDLILGITYIFLVPTIANNYLKNTLTYPTLYGMVLLLPLISLTITLISLAVSVFP